MAPKLTPASPNKSVSTMIKQLILLLLVGLMTPCAAQPDLGIEHFNCDSAATGKHEFSVLLYSSTASNLMRTAGGYHTLDGIRYSPQQIFYHGLLYTNRVDFDGSLSDPQKAISDYLSDFPDATIVFSGYLCEDFVSRVVQYVLIKDNGCCTHGEPYDLPKLSYDTTGTTYRLPYSGSDTWKGQTKDTITIKGVIHHAPVVIETENKPKKRKQKFFRER
jgi:hypothetical protein